ncbi:hypothetical protein BGW39_008708 [Mortierella sp. 14UC]|nr:hypothetical protein BGW39_008708 [Mortierella sp. 14UC]
MPHLISEGYRLDGVTGRMALELGLHRLQRPAEFESESARIAFEIKSRILGPLICSDSTTSIVSGLPGTFHDPTIALPVITDDLAWWVERIAVTGRPMEPVDDYTLSILNNIMKPRRVCLSMIIHNSGQGGPKDAPGGDTEDVESSKVGNKVEAEGQEEDNFQVLQMCLNKCVFAADEIVAMVEQFKDIVDRTSSQAGEVEGKLMACQRCLRILGPYWKGAADQSLLLERLSSPGGGGASKSGADNGSSSSSSMELLADIMMTTPSTDADEKEDFAVGHISDPGREQATSRTAYLESDQQAEASLEARLETSGKQKEGKLEVDGVISAFLTLDSGVGTMWGRPEKLTEVEETTLLSLEKLSTLEYHVPKGSSS